MNCHRPGYWRTFGAGAANYFVIWAGTGIGAAVGYQREIARLESRASAAPSEDAPAITAGARLGDAADEGLVPRTVAAIQRPEDAEALALGIARGGLIGALVAAPIGLAVQVATQRGDGCKAGVGGVLLGNIAAGLVGAAAIWGADRLGWSIAARTAIGAALPFATTPIRQAMLR